MMFISHNHDFHLSLLSCLASLTCQEFRDTRLRRCVSTKTMYSFLFIMQFYWIYIKCLHVVHVIFLSNQEFMRCHNLQFCAVSSFFIKHESIKIVSCQSTHSRVSRSFSASMVEVSLTKFMKSEIKNNYKMKLIYSHFALAFSSIIFMQSLLIFATQVNESISDLKSPVTDQSDISRTRSNLRGNADLGLNQAHEHVQMRRLEGKTCRLKMYWEKGYFWQEGTQIH